MNSFTLSHEKLGNEKRGASVPVIRFLPDENPTETSRLGFLPEAVCALSLEERQAYVQMTERLGVSPEDLMLAGFACLLARLTRQDTLVIEVGSAEAVVFRFEEDSLFLTAVHQAGNRQPLAQIAVLAADRGASYRFAVEGQSTTTSPTSALRLQVRDDGSFLELASPSGMWPEDTLRSWLGHLLTLIQSASRDPGTAVNRLPLWDEADARKFYATLNQTRVNFPGEACVTGRFAVQARRRPAAAAVLAGGRRYSYRELDERSTELARYLIARGATSDRGVAVCMERSVELPLALLAVLKSGSFYVPLDPYDPAQRLARIREECNPAVLLTDRETAASIVGTLPGNLASVLCVDQLWNLDGTWKDDGTVVEAFPQLPEVIDPASTAYTIYTSGTTGEPKGVPIQHQALLNLICSIWREPGVGETDRMLAVAPISFDIGTMDMFLPLCAGGTVVIASRQAAVDPHRLAELIREHDITCMQATPATWRMLVSSGWSGKRDLKMISGGEALPRELANQLLLRGGELWNCYGPTETTIYSSVLRIHSGFGIVPLGPPLPNTRFYVMDPAGNLVPPGITGELYIGGLGVSPGYVARPEKTARRFVPDQLASPLDVSTGSLFPTGDLVRIVPDHRFEFFGRLDDQVKLRGFRIELGEIESVLRTYPLINDAVVVLREDIPGEPRLVAYVTSSAPLASSVALRVYVSKSLPDYMVPSLVVTLEQLPLSASGKIDRRGLPLPESIPSQIVADQAESVAARDELESKLLRIFRDVLKNDFIGVTDSFFLYGGYSLLTVRLFSQIDRELHVRLPISLLFDAPTVRDLAWVVRKGVSPSAIVPIRPNGRSAPIFLIQSYLLYSAILEIVEPDRPVFGLREMGYESEPISIKDRARNFAQEIVAAYPHGPFHLAGWCAAGTLTIEIAHYLHENGHQVGLVALFDGQYPGFAPPKGLKPWALRQRNRFFFHVGRIRHVPWHAKLQYVLDAAIRNWEPTLEVLSKATQRIRGWRRGRTTAQLPSAAFSGLGNPPATPEWDGNLRIYPGQLSLYRASDVPDLAESDKTLGWSTIAQGGVKVSFVSGDHESMFKKPNSASLASCLQRELRESDAAALRI
jgi:amino acid adenylation domain-containing protein